MDIGSKPTHSLPTMNKFTYSKHCFVHTQTILLFALAAGCYQFDNPIVVRDCCYCDEADSFTESGSSTPLSTAFSYPTGLETGQASMQQLPR